jgi:diguanylate cyclase (GGDEF)-like protein
MTHQHRILIVDDDPMAIQSLYNVLEGYGDIRFATSGQDGLDMLQKETVDLVLLDANMPILDGYSTCRILKRDFPDIPVIFVTASHDPSNEVQALEAGAVDFITKPLNPPVVQARVNTQLQLKRHGDQLRAMTKSDPLTGIANRRFLDEQLQLEWRRSMRNQSLLSVLMIDIDFFKAFNDHYGHIEGDACLRKVAETIQSTVNRAGELAARYGGEEFAALLPHTSPECASEVAEKICATIRELAIPHVKSPVSDRVTVSIGVAGGTPCFPPEPHQPIREHAVGDPNSIDELFRWADDALYKAKQSGRNRVVMSHGTAVQSR